MIKLDPEHIHLLLDEPIYVLHEHFESTVKQPTGVQEENETYQYKGDNKKGIIIINEIDSDELISEEDEEFLFKGLNALDISLEDVRIISSGEFLAAADYRR